MRFRDHVACSYALRLAAASYCRSPATCSPVACTASFPNVGSELLPACPPCSPAPASRVAPTPVAPPHHCVLQFPARRPSCLPPIFTYHPSSHQPRCKYPPESLSDQHFRTQRYRRCRRTQQTKASRAKGGVEHNRPCSWRQSDRRRRAGRAKAGVTLRFFQFTKISIANGSPVELRGAFVDETCFAVVQVVAERRWERRDAIEALQKLRRVRLVIWLRFSLRRTNMIERLYYTEAVAQYGANVLYG